MPFIVQQSATQQQPRQRQQSQMQSNRSGESQSQGYSQRNTQSQPQGRGGYSQPSYQRQQQQPQQGRGGATSDGNMSIGGTAGFDESGAGSYSNRLGQGTPVASGPPASAPVPDVREGFYGGGDPYQQYQNNRNRYAAQGDMMNQQLQDYRNSEDWYRQNYRAQGDQAYQNIAAGNGGYRPGETADIIGREGLQNLQQTPEQRNALFLSDQEQAANAGDPNKAEGWFDPAWYDALNTEGNTRINESVNQGAAGQRNAYDAGAADLRGSYDPSKLGLRAGYGNDVNAALTGTEGAVRGAVNRPDLTQSQDFVNRYRMSDRDVNDYTQSAALTQGALTRGRVGAVNRAAAASGGGNALALASGLNNLSMTGDQQAQDAMLRARLAAKGEQAGREKDIESMRLDANGNYAGLASSAELALGGRRYGALQDTEGMRLGAEGGIADRGMNVASTLGARNLANEQSIADRGYNSANQQYQNNMGNARYIGETGANLARGTDDRNVARSQYNSANRQDNERYAQNDQYNRGLAMNDRISQRTQQNAAPRLSQEQEYRNYLLQQQGLANGNVNTAFGNQLTNNSQTGNLINQATQGMSQYDLGRRGQSFGTNFKGAFGTALGGFLGNPAKSLRPNG